MNSWVQDKQKAKKCNNSFWLGRCHSQEEEDVPRQLWLTDEVVIAKAVNLSACPTSMGGTPAIAENLLFTP